MKHLRVLPVLFLLLLPQPRDLAAQLWDAGAPGEETITFSLAAGVLSPQTEFSDASSFDSATALATAVTYWPLRHMGLRVHAARGETDAIGEGAVFSPIESSDPVQYLFGLEAVLRYPMASDRISWFPYVSGGPGGKTYRWELYQPSRGGQHKDTNFALTYGGGIEIRFGASQVFGLTADFRTASSDFVWFGLDESQSDFLFTGGISVSY